MIHYIRLEKAKRLPDYTTTYRKDGIWVKHGAGDWRKYHHFPKDEAWPGYNKVDGLGPGSVEIHPLHGRKEIPVNIGVAKFLSCLGYHVKLLPIVDALVNAQSGSHVEGLRSADFYIRGDAPLGGKVWELENVSLGKKSKAIRDAILKGAKQWKNVIIHPDPTIPGIEVITGIERFSGLGRAVNEVALVYRDTVIVLSQKDIEEIKKPDSPLSGLKHP